MRVTIPIEFDVDPACAEDELTENDAKSAADMAAYDYLSFVKISGYSSDSESVEVHVDGFGMCVVSLAKA